MIDINQNGKRCNADSGDSRLHGEENRVRTDELQTQEQKPKTSQIDIHNVPTTRELWGSILCLRLSDLPLWPMLSSAHLNSTQPDLQQLSCGRTFMLNTSATVCDAAILQRLSPLRRIAHPTSYRHYLT